jgi:hypothetical protein
MKACGRSFSGAGNRRTAASVPAIYGRRRGDGARRQAFGNSSHAVAPHTPRTARWTWVADSTEPELPLRGLRDRDALRAGLADGTIDAVCSDTRRWMMAKRLRRPHRVPQGSSCCCHDAEMTHDRVYPCCSARTPATYPRWVAARHRRAKPTFHSTPKWWKVEQVCQSGQEHTVDRHGSSGRVRYADGRHIRGT